MTLLVEEDENNTHGSIFKNSCRVSLSFSLGGSRFTMDEQSLSSDLPVVVRPLEGLDKWMSSQAGTI